MEYIEQSYKDLNLTISKNIDLNDFTLLVSKDIRIGDINISLHIIGESHIIKYTTGDKYFYEIFACKILDDQEVLLSKSISKLTKESFPLNGKQYSFEVFIKDQLSENILEGYEEYLEFIFPKGSKTALWVKGENKTLLIKTLHSYQNENKYIYTSTTIGDF